MKNPNGRPKLMTKMVVGKLEEAFALDCTVKEACFYADISTDTYYAYMKENKDFSDRITGLRSLPILAARMSVLRAIEKDGNLALKYLERKRPTEFNTRHIVIYKDDSEKFLTKEETEKIAKNAMNVLGDYLNLKKKPMDGKRAEDVG